MKLSKHESLVYHQISRNLLHALSRKGLKQEVIAESLGMKQNHLSEKLHGKHGIQIMFIIRLSAATQIPFSDLIGVDMVDKFVKLNEVEITQGIALTKINRSRSGRSQTGDAA